MSSSFALAQDLRFGQPFEGVTLKAGVSWQFGEVRRDDRGPQLRFTVEAGSEQQYGVLGTEQSYRSMPLTGLRWDFGRQLSMNMGGLTAYQYDDGKSRVLPALYATGHSGDGWTCDAVCGVLIVIVAVGAGLGLYYAIDDNNGNIVRRTSGNDSSVVNIHINN